ncbi:hypothetical protein JTB14_016942 [Gonioctena quinquepunctata]|nr:hypothetical protein JTB14_016942 [Gonioctena quinquepunctata]
MKISLKFEKGVVAKANIPNNSLRTPFLAEWIALIKIKKQNLKCKKRRNLSIEAVLNKALTNAETELRRKQHERRLRWHHLKSSLGITQNDSCDIKSSKNWDTKACEELTSSLDDFMSQLKAITVHIQR